MKNRKRGEMEVTETMAVVLVWIVALAGILIMKKIQPEDKIYPAWAATICIIFTLFVKFSGF